MRLIDADALKEDIKQQCALLRLMKDNDEITQISAVLEFGFMAQIDKMPTIERKKGKWKRWYEKLEDASGVEYIPFCLCSECETQYDPHSSKFINFCPNCGADMRGET